ncbi:HD-GYP domain-containing protein [Gayadomonas joobiniege]|uniref:HD-GYP domain-containing protein n=1 Tax=Gayadomonas joobiniege TaxID=1234606 RepID=UPI00035FF017|nr:HD-GYP domain-containing protein [Gayadomonas joobiniege]
MKNNKIVLIDELQPGSYVIEVYSERVSLNVTSSGWVTSNKAIQMLKDKGVEKVLVDPNRSQPIKTNVAAETAEHKPKTNNRYQYKTTDIKLEMGRAKRLYQGALSLQKRILNEVKLGQNINLSAVKKTCLEMIDSVFYNPNALPCLTALREKESYLFQHSLNVCILAAMFSRYLKKTDEEIELIAQAAFLHDVGKVQIPPEILDKPGRLNADEFEIIKQHVQFGVDLLKKHTDLGSDALNVIAQHHEQLSGGGYPAGLKGEQICQAARIVSIVDIYDALTSERVYKKGMTAAQAYKIMLKMSEDALDKALVKQFINCMGIYPLGSLVLLSNKRLAVVVENNSQWPIKPKVKTFYHTVSRHYTEVKECDLSKLSNLEIEASVQADEYNIPIKKLYDELLFPA